MAQLGFRTAGIALVLSSIVACGGRLGVADPAADDAGTDTGDHVVDSGRDTLEGDLGLDGGHPDPGWHSYTASIGEVKRFWTTSPRPTLTDPSKGWSGRIDLDDGRDLGSTPGSFGPTTDRYDSMTIAFGSDGRATAATLSGRTEVVSGDIAYEASVTAAVSLSPDEVHATWRARTIAAFAPIALPWEQRIFETSEPYEGSVSPEAFFGSEIATKIVPRSIVAKAHGTKADRGITFSLLDWDLSADLSGRENEVRDFAGNASLAGTVAPVFEGAKVMKRGSSSWTAGDDGGAAYLWYAGETTTGCREGKSCVQIGPFKASPCTIGSLGGIATRLAGSGTSTVSFRVFAKAIAGPPAASPPPGLMQLQLATPSGKLSTTPSAIAWPATPGADGTFDSGWTAMHASLPEGDAETGVALSAYGLGPAGGSGCGFVPAYNEWEVTVYVDRISVAGGK